MLHESRLSKLNLLIFGVLLNKKNKMGIYDKTILLEKFHWGKKASF